MLHEFQAHKNVVQENIMKSFGYDSTYDMLESLDTTTAIRKGIVEFDDELEKVVYADTAQNRKLGRVGQEYGGNKSGDNSNLIDANGKINEKNEKVKRDTIKDINTNGAGKWDDKFIDNNPTDFYKKTLKKYDVESVGELADMLDEKYGEDGIEKYGRLYTKMLREIPASAFHKEYGN